MKRSVILFLTLSVYLQIALAQNKAADNYVAIDKKVLQLADSQAKTTDKIAEYIKANFKTDKEKARAIYCWIATHIRYDLERLRNLRAEERDSDKITKTLLFRKGICENYAALFVQICTKSGIKCYTIEGYTKQNGRIVDIPHAWNAARIDGVWYLFDTTWGGGYVTNGKYIHQLNNSYFMVPPSSLIVSHMPFDYLWQFLNYPVTHPEFAMGKTSINKSKRFFNFNDSITAYERLDRMSQLSAIERRIEKDKITTSQLFDQLQHVKQEKSIIQQNQQAALFNSASQDYMDGMNNYNAYISYWNTQFIPMKSDLEIQAMLDLPSDNLRKALAKLNQIATTDSTMKGLMNRLQQSIATGVKLVTEQQEWLKEYLSKGKLKRKAMFVGKVTWYGVPLN